jgi:hypothetical protein
VYISTSDDKIPPIKPDINDVSVKPDINDVSVDKIPMYKYK